MRKFWYVTGQLVEVQRYINVPMRWCEQYPARERRELWLCTAEGQEIKLLVHSREMPARRGHQVTALLLGDKLLGLRNMSTGKQVNFVRADPPLLWRRCDAVAVVAMLLAGVGAFALSAWPAALLGLPLALMYPPLLVMARWAGRNRLRAQVDRVLEIVKDREAARPVLRRVK